MRAILYLVGRNTRRRWPSTVVLAALIAVTGALVIALAAGAARTLSAGDRYEDVYGGAIDATVEQIEGPPRTEELSRLPGVESVRTITFVFGGLVDGDGNFADAIAFAGRQEAFGTQMIAGREPTGLGEFAASKAFVDETGADLGDRYTLITLTQEEGDTSGFDTESPSGPTFETTLVGEFAGPADMLETNSFVLVAPEVLDVGDVGISASQHAVGLARGTRLADLREALDAVPDLRGFGTAPVELVPVDARQSIDARGQGVAVVAIVVALAAIAVIGQLIGRQLRIGESDADALTSLGLVRRDLIVEQVVRALVPISVGAMAAGPIAYLLSGRFPLGFVEVVEPRPGLRLESVHLWGPLVIVVGLTAWLLMSVSSAGNGRPATRPSLVEAAAVHTLPVPAAMALRFAFTRPTGRRAVATAPLVALGLVLATAVGALTFGATVARLIDEPARYGNPDLGLGQGGDEVPDEVVDALARDPALASVAMVTNLVVAVGPESIDLTGVRPVRGATPFTVFEGRPPAGPAEVMLGRVTAADLDVGVGDSVEVDTATGRHRLEVTGLGLISSMDGGDGGGLGGMVTAEALDRLEPGASYGSAIMSLQRPTASDTPDEVADRIATTAERLSGELGFDIGPPSPPAAIFNLERIRGLPSVVAAMLAALVVLGLAHQLLVSVRNRRRDLAVLRAIGADRRWVTSLVHWQAAAMVAAVAVVGVPLGVVAGRVVARSFVDRIGVVSDPSLPLRATGLGILALVVVANAVAAVPARRARTEAVAVGLDEA